MVTYTKQSTFHIEQAKPPRNHAVDTWECGSYRDSVELNWKSLFNLPINQINFAQKNQQSDPRLQLKLVKTTFSLILFQGCNVAQNLPGIKDPRARLRRNCRESVRAWSNVGSQILEGGEELCGLCADGDLLLSWLRLYRLHRQHIPQHLLDHLWLGDERSCVHSHHHDSHFIYGSN